MKRVQVGGLIVLLHVAAILLLPDHLVDAQTTQTSNATTDANEAAALNSIFQQWDISAPNNEWNMSGEVCSGFALGDTPSIDDKSYNPLIKCDCTYNSSTICRITALKVYALSVAGVIPDELWSLTYLTNLELRQNFLTGPLSESIGNLTRMQWLTFGINSLSGPLPKSLGLLTDLRSFSVASNGFSGSLPPELGNCRRLQQLYISSSGVSGEIPKSFANLTDMQTMWASNSNLTGRIPDFIGNWTKLQNLRFEGNSFEGPIPSSFSNLTSLVELRITGLANGSSSLDLIKNMKSLTTLSLRNNDLFGSIPSDMGQYVSLTMLDLSFNNLTGQIPGSLLNLSLTHLFLGNNGLTGSLPTRKNSALLNIDVSYNNLTGSIPFWVSEDNLQLNLIANNFTLNNTITRYLPSGLNCLQRGFPCNRKPPVCKCILDSNTSNYWIDSQFAIKCGGPQITSAGGIVYESDNETLGPATYYVASSNRWAVSNVGYFTGSNNPQYKYSSSSQFANTLDTELFQTCRLSASSLRYYGLGLQNGNYTVNLQFGEIVIQNGDQWQSLGRRLFDIYIQGNRVSTDFDIRASAGGQSFRVVPMNYTAEITENYLEIHLFWAGKGTCCIPTRGTYGPSISAISATPNFIPTVSNKPPSTGKDHNTGLIVGIAVGVGTVCFLLVFVVFFVVRRKKRQSSLDDEVFIGIENRPYTFHYSELKTATDDFSPDNKLGEGGFGPVYKGKLSDGRVIAVKQLSVQSHQGKNQFVTEIATISAVQHRSLVKLYGCCIEGDNRMLVYEFLENKSLDQALFGERSLNLDWPTRFDICIGVARGLAYLHEESRLRIVHRDVKASNILLDSELVPKISDFGLAKLYDDKKTHISTRVAGTIGYLSPEYAMRGHLTEKADVFAFGVVALEIVSGRPNSDSSLEEEKVYLLEWAWHLHENNREVELLDASVSKFNGEELIRVIGVSLLCTQASPNLRPPMSRVVNMLTGDIEVGNVTSRPGYLTDWKFDDVSSFMSNNPTIGTDNSHYNSSTSINTVHSPIDNASKPMLKEIIGDGR